MCQSCSTKNQKSPWTTSLNRHEDPLDLYEDRSNCKPTQSEILRPHHVHRNKIHSTRFDPQRTICTTSSNNHLSHYNKYVQAYESVIGARLLTFCTLATNPSQKWRNKSPLHQRLTGIAHDKEAYLSQFFQ